MDIEERKKILIDELRTIGVARLVIEYSGSGDSGAIDQIRAYPTAALVELETPEAQDSSQDVDDLADAHYGEGGAIAIRISNKLLGEKDQMLSGQLEKFAYDILEHFDVPDWVNNEGGRGELMIYVDGDEDEGYEPGHIQCEHVFYELVDRQSSYAWESSTP